MRSIILAAAALWLAAAGGAGAAVLGDTVSLSYFFPDLGTPYHLTSTPNPFVVAEGLVTTLELDFGVLPISFARLGETEVFTFDPSDDAFSEGAFNGPLLTDLTGPNFGAVVSVSGLSFDRVTSTGDSLRLNLHGLAFGDGSQVVVTLDASPAPEPAPWATLILGLGLAGAVLRGRAGLQQKDRRCA